MDKTKRRMVKLTVKILVSLVVLGGLKVSLDVLKVQDYRQASAHISLSPDGRYKALRMYVDEAKQSAWAQTALQIGGYSSNPLFAIADAASGEVLAFYHPPKIWFSDASGGSWECGKQDKSPCTVYYFPNFDGVPLPPPRWKQLQAQWTVKIKDLKNPEFSKVTVYE